MVPGLPGRQAQDCRNIVTTAKFVNKIKVRRLSEATDPAACRHWGDTARGFLIWLLRHLPQR